MSATRRLLVTAAAVTGLTLLASSQAGADARCLTVRGTYAEHPVSGPACTSDVGLCIAGDYRGAIQGPFSGRANTIVPTADTPTTNVLLFTADSSITTTLSGRSGTLLIKNAGVFSTVAPGSIVDVQTIVGGTGGLTGATGSIRASGTFVGDTGGESRYLGTVCLP